MHAQSHGVALAQGLGKTAQSIATLAFQKQFLDVTGPHIVIAPLTTLGHWRREIQTWTDMVCCLDHEKDMLIDQLANSITIASSHAMGLQDQLCTKSACVTSSVSADYHLIKRCMPCHIGRRHVILTAPVLQNVLEYTGSKADRQIIRKHEYYYADAKTKDLKFDVLLVRFLLTLECPQRLLYALSILGSENTGDGIGYLEYVKRVCGGMQTSYETVLRDSSVFLGIKWETMIADEAHRFKSVSGQTRTIITRMNVRWKLLLTGEGCQSKSGKHMALIRHLTGWVSTNRSACPAKSCSFLYGLLHQLARPADVQRNTAPVPCVWIAGLVMQEHQCRTAWRSCTAS